LIAAAWLGPFAARLGALVIAVAAIWATKAGVGAFTGGSARENLQNLDLLFMGVSLTRMALGAFTVRGGLLFRGGVLVAGMAVSGWLYSSMDSDRRGYDEGRFERVIQSVDSRITGRLTGYANTLAGAAGFLGMHENVIAEEWRSFVTRLGAYGDYPGVEG